MTFTLLQFKAFMAPDVYLFRDPDTGRKFEGETKEELIKQIVAYRAQNELEPLEYLGLVIDSYMCSMPRYRHLCAPGKPFGRSIFGYISGGIALVKNIFYGERNMVSQKVADRRSIQCTSCKFNVFPDKKGFLKWSDQVAEASTHGRKAKNHDKLGNCEVCSCPLRAKVWYKGHDKFSDQETHKFKEVNCWQLKQ